MEEIEKLLVDLRAVRDRTEALIEDLLARLHREESARSPIARALRGLFDSVSMARTSTNQNLEAIRACKDACEALDRYW